LGFSSLRCRTAMADSWGGVLLIACGMLAGSVILGRVAWKPALAEGSASMQPRGVSTVAMVTVIAVIQLCICLYWVGDLLIYAVRH
jgi:hypothetical protein